MNGVLVVDKAQGMTSHDVVARARRAFGTRSVGHAGTLDPMATGVLVLGINQGTKLLQYLSADDKEYEGELRLGIATHSEDADGEVIEKAPVPPQLDEATVHLAAESFLGEMEQRVPKVSAVKVDGMRLHARTRRGEDVEAPSRRVRCDGIDVLDVTEDRIRFRVRCGKGFYVRALARDWALALGTVGHLSALRRIRSGAFGVDQAVGMGTLEGAIAGDDGSQARLRQGVLGIRDAWADRPTVVLTDDGLVHARCGRRIPPDCVVPGATSVSPGALVGSGDDGVTFAALDHAGEVVAFVRPSIDGGRVVRGFHE
ncbi:MAG: tRNA pseudouridine(55) synthase TruB [Myxococcales bacterium]|nr:tRNA pseudouridine(55) synthase TruB [Myxococcales bacterium]